MKTVSTARAVAYAAALLLSAGHRAHAALSLSLNLTGSFGSVLDDSEDTESRIDNNLTNGHTGSFDLHDKPSFLSGNNGTGPAGSAAFQWGDAANDADYPHTSALWFNPSAVINAQAETPFVLGHLYYRNGTIEYGTGANGVTLSLALNFTSPLVLASETSYQLQLINTNNTSNADDSADIVKLGNVASLLNFTDDLGNGYFLELTFQVDLDNTDGSLSTLDQFRVHEGDQGRAILMGRFTVDPIDPPVTPAVPEPSICALTAGGLILWRRKRCDT